MCYPINRGQELRPCTFTALTEWLLKLRECPLFAQRAGRKLKGAMDKLVCPCALFYWQAGRFFIDLYNVDLTIFRRGESRIRP